MYSLASYVLRYMIYIFIPLLRGLDIGMAHGYLLLGPFEKLGPLRESELSLLIGFLSSVALVTLLTVCLAMYGKVTFEDSDLINTNELLTSKNWNQFTSGFFIVSFGGVSFVTKGGRRFMAAWRQEEEDAARHRQEKREATRLGKLQSHTEA